MISFDRLDLNLLRIFDAVMEERSVLRASQRLHLSQSAVSHALARLRESVGEDLFIRTSNGMKPTDFALEISVPLHAALQSMNSTLSRASPPFQPGSMRKTFVIAANDYVSAILLPHFNRTLSQIAPGIDLVIRPSTRLDLAEQIDLRRIDLAIGTFSSIPERLHSQLLMQQDEVLICSAGHPLAAEEITIGDVANYPLAVVSLGGEEDGAVSGFILERGLARQSEMYDRKALDQALQQAGLQIRGQMTIPHFLAIPSLLENSELMAIVPRPLAKVFSRTYSLAIQELPYPVTTQRLDIVWHSHNDLDAAHCWLRSQLCETVRHIQAIPESAGNAEQE
ncbi:LysR substrate-binding domain-containing protein [Undibacterium terreum]|uniref:LysR family transcriptional regulator n=1 Tax=Undibacterium terreum TaxID=1224302 RepID=A0A916XNA4_9BURK|nr:LysR substrate-binding domain-containing protein [Undibacterium terreum]GGC88857.1 LysR family transcriptional regulator [Undibacterium terreum]